MKVLCPLCDLPYRYEVFPLHDDCKSTVAHEAFTRKLNALWCSHCKVSRFVALQYYIYELQTKLGESKTNITSDDLRKSRIR